MSGSKAGKLIEVGQFVTMQDSTFAEHNVKKGDLLYIAGDSIVAVTEKDPYALRKVFVAAYTNNGSVDATTKPFIVDGKRLKPVSKAKQEKLDAQMQEDFGGKEDVL